MKKVLVESPFAGKDKEELQRNIRYARLCLHDCFLRNEAPFASHLLYTQPGILDDNDARQRHIGIEAGLLWGGLADMSVFYIDFGYSRGMLYGKENAIKANRPWIERKLPDLVMQQLSQTNYEGWAW